MEYVIVSSYIFGHFEFTLIARDSRKNKLLYSNKNDEISISTIEKRDMNTFD